MSLKRIIGSHFANYREAWEANELVGRGLIHPTLSRAYPKEQVGQAAYDVHRNLHQGKVGVLTLSPEEASASPTSRSVRRSPSSSAASATSEPGHGRMRGRTCAARQRVDGAAEGTDPVRVWPCSVGGSRSGGDSARSCARATGRRL